MLLSSDYLAGGAVTDEMVRLQAERDSAVAALAEVRAALGVEGSGSVVLAVEPPAVPRHRSAATARGGRTPRRRRASCPEGRRPPRVRPPRLTNGSRNASVHPCSARTCRPCPRRGSLRACTAVAEGRKAMAGENSPEDSPVPGDCPPEDAIPACGTVFRCCKSDPPAESGMRTNDETGRLPDAPPCLRRALSVFRTRQDAVHQLRLFRRWRRKLVAQADLEERHGRTKQTSGRQPTHTSWWPSPGLNPSQRAALFSVVSEVEQ